MTPKSGHRFSEKIMRKENYTTTVNRFAARVMPV